MRTLAPKIGELALTAAVLIPRITWIPNFRPIACTCCATSVKPLPLRDDGQRSGSGIGRPHSSIKSWPADHTEAPASSFRYHRKSTTTYCTEKEKLSQGHIKNHIRACKAQKAMNHMLHAYMNMLPILVNCNTYISEFKFFLAG